MTSSTAADLQRRLDDLLEHLPAGVVVHGVDGGVLHANRLACELIGQSLEELRGGASSGEAWKVLCADGTPMPREQFPVNLVLRTGRQQSQQVVGIGDGANAVARWLVCNAYPERDGDGVLCRVVMCFTDCTALKRAQQDLQQSEERLRLASLGATGAHWDGARAEQRIHELADVDHLTGLPNRRLLVEELDRALARSRRSRCFGAVIFVDLDNFKLLNDTMGHDVGDMLLRQIADRLRHTVRHCDQLARLGGDEFVLVLENLAEEAQEAVSEAQHFLEKLQSSLAQPYYLDDRLFLSTPNIGVALFDAAATDIETLLEQADLAMYRAKSEGRNTARFFDPGMQASAEHQAALEHALREGLSAHQFVLYCQPQFCRQGRLVGAEVLLRWRRADGALLGPDQFIGLAESSGLILPLGQYVLEESCRALSRWRADRALGRLDLAVNISAHQLRSADFSERVAEILHDTGAPAHKLCLELRESDLAQDAADVIERMHALRSQGVHFSLDDFGTGCSSLAYLKRLPLSALKIDRSFVHEVHLDPDAAPIVAAIIALARTLDLGIVAEGVEHEAQRSFLVDGGCGTLQGFLLGRPVPMWEFERLYSGEGVGHA